MIYAAIVHDPIENGDVLSHVASDEDGAVLLFLGIVRDHADGRPVTGMTYEAYEEMATPVLREIANEASGRLKELKLMGLEASYVRRFTVPAMERVRCRSRSRYRALTGPRPTRRRGT